MVAFAGILASLAVALHVGFDVDIARAHVAPIDASCENGLQITLNSYEPAGVNLLRVWIDGDEVAATTFGSSASVAFPFGDLFVSHTYRVSVSAWDDPNGEYEWSFDTGTLTIPVCAETTTTAATATTAPAAVATTTPAAVATTTPAATVTTTTTPAVGPVSSAVITAPPATPGPTTTVLVAQAGATLPSGSPATVVTAVPGTLPVTGGDDLGLAASLAALLAGAALVLAARRPA